MYVCASLHTCSSLRCSSLRSVAGFLVTDSSSRSLLGLRILAMEALQQSVTRAAVAPVNGVVASPGARVSQVKMAFVAGSGASMRNNAALVAKVAKSVSASSSGRKGVVVMMSESAAGGYATALAELSQATDNLEKIGKDVEYLGELLNNKELYEFLASPVIDGDKKKSILKTLAVDAEFSDVTINFLNLLVDKKRIELIQDIVKEFEAIYNELTDTQMANVISAVKIEKPQLALIAKKIRSLCGAKNVRIRNIVDGSLIAGFIVQYGKDGSRFIDMSIKGKLDRLASKFAAAEQAAGAH